MVVASMEQDGNGIPFVKITLHVKGLRKNADKVEIVWGFGLESIQTLNKRSTLKIPYDSNSSDVIKGPLKVNFIDENENIVFRTQTV